MKHIIKLSRGGTIEVDEHDLVNIYHYKQAAEVNRKGWQDAEQAWQIAEDARSKIKDDLFQYCMSLGRDPLAGDEDNSSD